MKRLGFSVPVVLGLMCSAAFADSFYLTVPENACATTNAPCIPANSVLVDVTQSGSTASVSFTAESVNGVQYAMSEVLFEVNGNFGLSSIVITGGAHAGTTLNPAPNPGSIDEMGLFSEESIHMTNASEVVFNLTGGSWSSAANVLTTTPLPNGNHGGYPYPFDAAAIVRVADCTSTTQPGCTSSDVSAKNGAGTFGSGTSDTAGAAVPEPTSIILLGSVALLIGGAFRKKLAQ